MKQKVHDCIKPELFSGAVICLTALSLCDNRDATLPNELVELLEDSNRVIGVEKKGCWAYHLMGGKSDVTPPFQLPGMSGLIYPWAPPHGISLPVLNEINSELKSILLSKLKRAVKTMRDNSRHTHDDSEDEDVMRIHLADLISV